MKTTRDINYIVRAMQINNNNCKYNLNYTRKEIANPCNVPIPNNISTIKIITFKIKPINLLY